MEPIQYTEAEFAKELMKLLADRIQVEMVYGATGHDREVVFVTLLRDSVDYFGKYLNEKYSTSYSATVEEAEETILVRVGASYCYSFDRVKKHYDGTANAKLEH